MKLPIAAPRGLQGEGDMGSVRDRVERELREAPEQIVETACRRVALGASGPTLSTRQREQIAADQSEVLEASPHTRSGSTDFMSGNLSRVRDRQVVTEAMRPESLRPKTESELAGEAGLAMHERWAREAKAAEQANIAARAERDVVDNLKKTLVTECGFSADAAERRARELRRK